VGDGSQINIWEDSWPLSSQNLKIQTPQGNNHPIRWMVAGAGADADTNLL
jgi:hypothetical protein